MLSHSAVVDGVAEQVVWWVGERRKKFVGLSHESMAVNPFLAPLLMSMHGMNNFQELAEFLLASHFYQGHATGFGKLIDEKVLPNVFGSTKLDRAFRRTPPYNLSIFDEIDHVVKLDDGSTCLMSQKAGKWTIQLTMAVQLNKAFHELIQLRDAGKVAFDGIVVGVFYGNYAGLTDKYDILRGINRGANHDVVDLTNDVSVFAGRDFWTWLNNGEANTQAWVMEGIIQGFTTALNKYQDLITHVTNYKRSFVNLYSQFVSSDGEIDWVGLMCSINDTPDQP